jgi:hypothetical protein
MEHQVRYLFEADPEVGQDVDVGDRFDALRGSHG